MPDPNTLPFTANNGTQVDTVSFSGQDDYENGMPRELLLGVALPGEPRHSARYQQDANQVPGPMVFLGEFPFGMIDETQIESMSLSLFDEYENNMPSRVFLEITPSGQDLARGAYYVQKED